jgi:hypothetical protein
LGVDGGGVVRSERGKGLAEKEGGRVPRAPLSPRVQTKDDKRKKGLQNLWTSKRRSPVGFPPPLVGLKKKKGEEGCNKARVFMFENSNPKSNLFAKILKTFRKNRFHGFQT